MSSSTVEQIKAKLGIVDVVGLYVKLEKAGANFKAPCPFHNEKTPSFFVSPTRGSYYCFGCGAKGDIFSFIQEFEGTDFVGALKNLAERAGVTLEYEKREMKSERDRLYSAMEHSMLHFQKNLGASTDALLYLKKRGLKIESVRDWKIGFAPIGWTNLRDYLSSKGFSDSEMEKAGLIKRADDDRSRFYDRFRGRIMFPIFDSSGRVVAFSGRILVDDGIAAKYLNSPETPLFSKSEILYGFDRAKLDIRRANAAVIVEGQMDLLMSQQAGVKNTVAVSGTALTTQHLTMLKRLAPAVVLGFDSDSAGFNAALKSAEAALGMGIEVKVVEILGGKDPADIALADPELWKKMIADAKHIVDFVLARIIRTETDKLKLLREVQAKVLPYVARIESSIEQAHFVQKIAHESGVREEALWEELKKMPKVQATNQPVPGIANAKPNLPRKSHNAIERIFGILFSQLGNKENADAPPSVREAQKRLKEMLGEEVYKENEAKAEEERSDLVFEVEVLYGKGNIEAGLEDLFQNLEEDLLKKKLADMMGELQEAERKKDKSKAIEIVMKCKELSEKLSKLKNKI